MKEKLQTLEKGTYYIGDLCYIVSNNSLGNQVWDEMCDYKYDDEENFNGLFKHKLLPKCTWGTNTFYGDGEYSVYKNGHYYGTIGVDSGSIGCVKINDEKFNNKDIFDKNGLSLGVIINFDNDFQVWYDNGIFHFGEYEINTRD